MLLEELYLTLIEYLKKFQFHRIYKEKIENSFLRILLYFNQT